MGPLQCQCERVIPLCPMPAPAKRPRRLSFDLFLLTVIRSMSQYYWYPSSPSRQNPLASYDDRGNCRLLLSVNHPRPPPAMLLIICVLLDILSTGWVYSGLRLIQFTATWMLMLAKMIIMGSELARSIRYPPGLCRDSVITCRSLFSKLAVNFFFIQIAKISQSSWTWYAHIPGPHELQNAL